MKFQRIRIICIVMLAMAALFCYRFWPKRNKIHHQISYLHLPTFTSIINVHGDQGTPYLIVDWKYYRTPAGWPPYYIESSKSNLIVFVIQEKASGMRYLHLYDLKSKNDCVMKFWNFSFGDDIGAFPPNADKVVEIHDSKLVVEVAAGINTWHGVFDLKARKLAEVRKIK